MQGISIIAIDGPAGSGKSTLGKHLARRLGFLYFDTGVLYRAVACEALARRLDIHDEGQITGLAEKLAIEVLPPSKADGRDNDLLADGVDITWAIRSPEVDGCVSTVSAYPGVRQALSAQQRRIGRRGRVVVVGRDIGTVVFPEADLKIYLEASPQERARRRLIERQERGETADYESTLASILERDKIDSSREVSPLRAAEDACVIDSDGLAIEEVVAAALKLLEMKADSNSPVNKSA